MTDRELDVLVEEHFFNYKLVFVKQKHAFEGTEEFKEVVGDFNRYLPGYSSRIQDTWRLVDKIEEDGGIVSYSTMVEGRRIKKVVVGILKNPVDSFHTYGEAQKDTISRSIVRAALRALGVEIDTG